VIRLKCPIWAITKDRKMNHNVEKAEEVKRKLGKSPHIPSLFLTTNLGPIRLCGDSLMIDEAVLKLKFWNGLRCLFSLSSLPVFIIGAFRYNG
jgi:hypothetical protein